MEIREEFLKAIHDAYEYCWERNAYVKKHGFIDLRGLTAVEFANLVVAKNVPPDALIRTEIDVVDDSTLAWVEWSYEEVVPNESRIEFTRQDFFHYAWNHVYQMAEANGLKLTHLNLPEELTRIERLALYEKYMAGEYGMIIDLFLSYYNHE